MFTKWQRAEILSLIEIREDTIECDPESADQFEQTEGALECLKQKIVRNADSFTVEEKGWIVRELEVDINKAQGNKGHGQNKEINIYSRNIQRSISKLLKP